MRARCSAVFAVAEGVDLPAPVEVTAEPVGETVALWESAPLDELLADMLEFSTNLTAEVMGLSASLARDLHRRHLNSRRPR